MELSVIICTHNPKMEYLQRVLAALEVQNISRNQWELLVVDNASTVPFLNRLRADWLPHFRVVREDRLGLTPARLTGISESKGDLLVFVDDDNFLDPDYLQQSLNIANSYAFLGAWSGQCRPEFDETPPEWTRQYWGNLVIRQFENETWSNLPRLAQTMPCGAGLCVRRSVAQKYLRKQQTTEGLIQLDRKGDSLVSGGDNDLAATSCSLGLGVGLFSSLKLTHKIPSQRLTLDYLAKLAEGISYSSIILDNQYAIVTPPRTLGRRLLDFIRCLSEGRESRVIAAAVARGQSKALSEIASKKKILK